MCILHCIHKNTYLLVKKAAGCFVTITALRSTCISRENQHVHGRTLGAQQPQGALTAHPLLNFHFWNRESLLPFTYGQLPPKCHCFSHDGEHLPKTVEALGEPVFVVANFIPYSKSQPVHFKIHGILWIFYGGLAPIQRRLAFLQDKIQYLKSQILNPFYLLIICAYNVNII